MSGLLDKKQIAQERMATMARVFARADRVLSGEDVTCDVVSNPQMGAPAWSNGRDITFNLAFIGDVTSVDDIIKVTGLNYHELSHVLFTPRKGTTLVANVIQYQLFPYFNMLEDQRIETMLTAMYPATEPYFVTTIMRYLLGHREQWDTAFPLLYGRKYLPDDARKQFEARFNKPNLIPALKKVIDEYRLLVFPRDFNRAFQLIRDYAALLGQVPNMQPMDPFGHSAKVRENPMDKGQPKGQGTQDSAQDKVQEKDEEQDKGKGKSSKPKDEQKDDDEDDAAGGSDSEDEDTDGGGSGDGDSDSDDDDSDDDGDGSGAGDDGDGDSGADEDSDDAESGSGGGDGGGDLDGDGSGGDWDTSEGGDSSSSSDKGGKGIGGGYNQAGDDPVASDGDLADLLDKAATKAENLPDVQTDARTKQDVIVNGDRQRPPQIAEQAFTEVPVPGDVLGLSRRFGKTLTRLRDELDPGWHRGESSGRLNVQRAMQGADLDTVWDRWDEGKNDTADCEVVILLDYSSSMGATLMDQASQAMWTIKRAFEDINGRVTVIGFASSTRLMYDGNKKVERVTYRRFACGGGTSAAPAVDEAMRIFHASRRKTKILFSITDGGWYNGIDGVVKCTQHGIVTAMGYLKQPHTSTYDAMDYLRQIGAQGHQVAVLLENPADILTLADHVVKARLKQKKS